jgi:uroporphyrinogen III methyltransferase/synthase
MKISSDKKILSGKTLVVTRALAQSGSLSKSLKNLGAETIEYPCIEIEVLPDLPKKICAFGDFKQFTDIIFTSVNGARIFLQVLGNKKRELLLGKTIFAIGPKTQEVLEEFGMHGSLIPKQFQAEAIVKMLGKNLLGRSFLLPRAQNARDVLPDAIQKRGGKVLDFPLYATKTPKKLALLDRPYDGICFTSTSTVENYARVNPIREKDVAFVIGNITAQSARAAGFKKVFIAKKATLECLVEIIKNTLAHGRCTTNLWDKAKDSKGEGRAGKLF